MKIKLIGNAGGRLDDWDDELYEQLGDQLYSALNRSIFIQWIPIESFIVSYFRTILKKPFSVSQGYED